MVETTQKLARITKRPDYLAVASTRRKWVTPSFILQMKASDGDSPPRAGFTASKKVGKAVIRSKARRRLKEAVRFILPTQGQQGWSYVFIARQAATTYPFEKLQADITWALAKLASGADLKTNSRRAGKNRSDAVKNKK